MSDAVVLVSAAIHALQKERGCSAVVELSKGELFSDKLERQRAIVDQQFHQLNLLLKANELSNVDAAELRRAMREAQNNLRKRRESKPVSVGVLMEQFSQLVITPLISLNLSLCSRTLAPREQLLALRHFVHWKERMALERGYGVKCFFQRSADEDQTQVMRLLVRKQREFEQAFLDMADGVQLQHAQGSQSEVSPVIDLTHSLLDSPAGADALAPLTVVGWFELLSRRIDELYQVELRLVGHLRESTGGAPAQGIEAKLSTELEVFRESILQLPMLQNLSALTVSGFLAQAEVVKRSVGDTLVSAGEKPAVLHIVLEGWVKICSVNEDGKEAILQLIGRGDAVVDAPIYRDVDSSVCARVEQDAVLLAVPAAALHRWLSQDSHLKTNALQGLAVRSQSQLQHLERLRLRSALERVGWFLLSLRTENESAPDVAPQNIVLPYNKATAASYLDMTPETFSRILKSFQKLGVTVSREIITLEQPRLLCSFCDYELASKCAFVTPNCQNVTLET